MAHWLLGTPAGSVVMIFLLVILGAASYFLPSLLAWARQAVSLRWIFLVNLLLAWTVIGWIVVLPKLRRSAPPVTAERFRGW